MERTLLSLVRELNSLNDDNLAERVVLNNDVQWCLGELQDILDVIGDMPVSRLRELAQADWEGKIPKYTIGDTIYDQVNYAWEVTDVELHLLAGEPKWIYRCWHIGTNDYCALWEFEVLTRAEAEEALRREQDE